MRDVFPNDLLVSELCDRGAAYCVLNSIQLCLIRHTSTTLHRGGSRLPVRRSDQGAELATCGDSAYARVGVIGTPLIWTVRACETCAQPTALSTVVA